MAIVKTLEDLKRIREAALEKRKAQAASGQARVTVGMGTCGIAAGARETMKAILDEIESRSLSGILVAQTGCIGKCEWEPIVEVAVGAGEKVAYGNVSPDRARQILQDHIVRGQVVSGWIIPE